MSGFGCKIDTANARLANPLSNVRSRRPPTGEFDPLRSSRALQTGHWLKPPSSSCASPKRTLVVNTIGQKQTDASITNRGHWQPLCPIAVIYLGRTTGLFAVTGAVLIETRHRPLPREVDPVPTEAGPCMPNRLDGFSNWQWPRAVGTCYWLIALAAAQSL